MRACILTAVSHFFRSIELVPSLEANVDMVLDDRTLCVVCVSCGKHVSVVVAGG